MDYAQLEQAFNDDIKEWSRLTLSAFEFKLIALGINDRALARSALKKRKATFIPKKPGDKLEKPLAASLRMAYKTQLGLINRVKIKFTRHGVYLEQGVGRNRKKGSGKEKPKKWLNPVLTIEVPKLADRIVDKYSDIIADQLTFYIPGIIEMTFDTQKN